MKRIYKSIISLALIAVMTVAMLSPIFAVTISGVELKPSDIVREDETKREAFAKHYLTGDGSYFAVAYTEQVNYLDGNEWVEVDNSLDKNILTGEKTTKNDKFKVKFSNKAHKDKLVTLQTEDFKISWGLTVSEDGAVFYNLNKVKNRDLISEYDENETTHEVQDLGKAVSGVVYENAYGDYLDVRYSVAHQKLKEDIILEEKSDFNSYKVTYDLGNKEITAVLEDNGEVVFCDTDGNILFKATRPIMYDSKGASSSEINVTLSTDKKTAEIIYTPSAEWLSSEERVYPVTLDPEVQTRNYASNYNEMIYNISSGTESEVTSNTFYISPEYHYYFSFNQTPSIPDFANITGASVNFVAYSIYYYYGTALFLSHFSEWWFPWFISDYGRTPNTDGDFLATPENGIYDYTEYDLITFEIPESTINNNNPQSYFSRGFSLYSDDGTGIYSSLDSTPFYRPVIYIRYSFTPSANLQSGSLYRFKNDTYDVYLTKSGNNFIGQAQESEYQYFKVEYSTVDHGYSLQAYTALKVGETNTYFGFEDNVSDSTKPNQTMSLRQSSFYWYIEPTIQNGETLFQIIAESDCSYSLYSKPSGYSYQASIKTGTPSLWHAELCQNQYEFWNDRTICVNKAQTLYLNPEDLVKDWTSSNEAVATVNEFGKVNTESPGRTVITALDKNNVQRKITIEVLLDDGYYFIKNRHTDNQRYITIDDNQNVNTDGAFMELWSFSGEDRQIWEIRYVGNGYYNIISKASGKYLLINDDRETVEEAYVRQGEYVANNHNQQWQITLTSHGSFKIANRATIEASSNLVMCMGQTAIENSNGVNVENRPYVDNDSYRDEWEIFLCDQDIAFISIDDKGFYEHAESIKIPMIQSGAYNYQVTEVKENDFTVDQVNEYLLTHSTIFISCHGEKSTIIFKGAEAATTNEYIMDINDILALDLQHVDLIVLMTCLNAQDNPSETVVYADNIGTPQNILEAFLKSGAKHVVAFNASVNVEDNLNFTVSFARHLYGYTPPLTSQNPITAKPILQALQNATVSPRIDGLEDYSEDCWVLGVQEEGDEFDMF